jgi:hypothetical protein
VSRSWREHYIAVLGPERVVLARRSGWRRPPGLLAETPCAEPSAEAALEGLKELLALEGLAAGRLTVLLSNHFVQYALVPWRAELTQPSELAAYAALCFDETYGSEAGGREISVAPERAGSGRVAAAIETRLLQALRVAAEAARFKLVSVRPYLPAAFDRLRGTLAARDFMFVLAEPTRSCVLVASGGHWRSLRSSAGTAHPRELANLIEREAQLAGLAEDGMPPVFVHAPGHEQLELPACHGVMPRLVSLPHGGSDPLLAMAMTVN